jgi:formate-dependent nitrite reductase cytochrome c552 subunit
MQQARIVQSRGGTKMSQRVKLLACIAVVLVLVVALPRAWAQTAAKAPATAAAKGPDYVGINKCKLCHIKEYKAWSTTKHAMALATLQKADAKTAADMAAKLKVEITGSPAATAACVHCHVTGFQMAGGYPAADSLKTAAVSNVTCEACHGPGGNHVKAPAAQKKTTIEVAPAESTCKGCHTPTMSPSFDFAKMKGLVHPVAAK